MRLPDEPVPLCALLSSEEGTVGGALDPAPSASTEQDCVLTAGSSGWSSGRGGGALLYDLTLAEGPWTTPAGTGWQRGPGPRQRAQAFVHASAFQVGRSVSSSSKNQLITKAVYSLSTSVVIKGQSCAQSLKRCSGSSATAARRHCSPDSRARPSRSRTQRPRR